MQSYEFQRMYGYTRPDAFIDVHCALANPDTFGGVLTRAANTAYPGHGFGPGGEQTAAECAEVAIDAGFWAGVAACWHYMTAINGQGGAR